ncbi:zinc-binding alcohol dehydrogenase family protein [Lactiplantibacillus garii]|uniref:Zinc-type alcohol dehydrogenase-like protein n=1 Tax=Lactiplantibacillus garii TaxID=2306423 RepID=A0A3R8J8B3_9LACO|nr:zinc-binding alcohol dehydrogenase family protein [Lactiplantibacillus garii]RRK10677.1 zinc-binding alcohol dehydrogenase family protein [Lactiplantibacillus garii]
MKAIGFTKHLPISNERALVDFETARPVAHGHDLLVHVTAVAVNPVDVFVWRGRGAAKETPTIIGWDAVGIVTAVGNACTLFQPGERVFYAGSFDRSGCDAEYQLVDERLVGHAPATLTDAQAAAMPLTSLTAWESLFELMPFDWQNPAANHAKRLLIINAAGGVGSVATQLAHLAGLRVIGTASRAQSAAWVQANGADVVINHHQELTQQLQQRQITSVDAVLELHNLTTYWPAIATLIKPAGTVVSTTQSNAHLNLNLIKAKRVRFAWEWMYSKSHYQTADMVTQHQILEQISQLLDAGRLKTTLTKTLRPINAANLREAHRLVESGRMRGKVVLTNA